MSTKTYEERRDRERRENRERGPGHETYDEKLGRYRRGWNEEDSRQYRRRDERTTLRRRDRDASSRYNCEDR